MTALYVLNGLLLGVIVFQFLFDREERRAKDQALLNALTAHQNSQDAFLAHAAAERAAWQKERVELLNRIQAPEVSAWQHPNPDAFNPPSIGFDDDEAFTEHKRLQAQMESGS